jgi:hypothetical protein
MPAEQAAEPSGPKTLALHAMQPPDPLLRYRLWPAPEHRRDENPAALVNRAVILSLQVSPDTKKDFVERYERWKEMPAESLPREEVRQLLSRYSHVFGELARCENLMRIDYNLQLDQLSATEMIMTLLPELQEMRQLARLIELRARLAIAEEHWDDVVDDCRLGFRLAEVAGHSTNFLVGRLVGLAVSGTMMGVIEEAIQRPACPNLYWALVSLPDERLFEMREALEYESLLLPRVLSAAGAIPPQPIGAEAAREKLRAIVRQANQMMQSSGENGLPDAAVDLMTGAYVVVLAEPARELLALTPQWAERAHELSASEAVLRASKLKLDRVRDRWIAWSMLPTEVWDEYAPERQAAFSIQASLVDVLERLPWLLMPAVDAARSAGRRAQQQRNLLLTLEAIRMHAAETGELPLTTEHMRPVPAWGDAMAAQPFGYQRSSPTHAVLSRAPRWPGNDPETSLHLELKAAP